MTRIQIFTILLGSLSKLFVCEKKEDTKIVKTDRQSWGLREKSRKNETLSYQNNKGQYS